MHRETYSKPKNPESAAREACMFRAEPEFGAAAAMQLKDNLETPSALRNQAWVTGSLQDREGPLVLMDPPTLPNTSHISFSGDTKKRCR